ncbi:VOC family protein [Puia sp.]|jgi:PhnB protein|uniref:VOC family protein n=1 Tax=Puia sp. TaxID=2045100 RepID=UPI002F3F7331
MTAFNIYLNYPGTSEEAFNFYKSIFGGEFTAVMRFGDGPEAGQLPPDAKNKIMHIALPVGNGNVLMATDLMEGFGPKYAPGNNFSVSVSPDTEEETKRIYDSLSAGATITMPLGQQFWGLFGSLTDRYGINWMINHMPKK